MPTPKSKLSKFILSLPSTLTGAQVVERVKATGMKTSRANVSRVRGLYGAKAVKTAPTKAAAPASSKTTNRSDFIRAQPASMSPADVVAKGKAEGIKFGRSLVYMVRGAATAKKGVAKKTSAAPTRATPANTAIKSKADFVRAYPSSSANEIVEKAKAEGIKLGWRYVYNVRATDKTAKRAKRAAAKVTPAMTTSVNGAAPSAVLPAPSSSTEDLLRAVAAELGLGRAVEILAGERARVRALIGG
jgi:hypothetical protein